MAIGTSPSVMRRRRGWRAGVAALRGSGRHRQRAGRGGVRQRRRRRRWTPTPGTCWSTATAARRWTCTTWPPTTAPGSPSGPVTTANNQQWQFVDSGGGYYRIKSRHSGKVLDVYNCSTADGGGDRAVDRRQRHQPAVPARRLVRRLRPADQPQQRQGPRGAGRLHRRRRQHRAVHRLGRHQPAVATRPGRRHHAADRPRRRRRHVHQPGGVAGLRRRRHHPRRRRVLLLRVDDALLARRADPALLRPGELGVRRPLGAAAWTSTPTPTTSTAAGRT